ncbi:GSCFA domain-containing protein [Dokdonia sp. LLG6352-1]|uniref:GSCFA domain-containing protein n=1 Tax=Dokdonia sp. LLG6352-1 TaxID=3160831 RepID=UPI003868EB03
MKLQTQIPLEPAAHQFGYDHKLLLLGSCFAQNIGDKLSYYKFQAVTNPFGIIFNPVALERLVADAVANKTYTEADVFELDGVWKSFYAHSDKNALTRLGAVIHLQEAQQLLRQQLIDASHLFITLGTAWVYKHLERDEVVANCHKVPQQAFTKKLLSVTEIQQSLSRICELAKTLNPKIEIAITVSPVRHIKDGIVENTRSKSHLLTAVHQLVDSREASYFPAYEIVMDELRDYRFYASDMVHPSEQAVTYVWERFVEVYAFAKAQQTMKKVAQVQQGLAHRPFNEDSAAHQKFITDLAKKQQALTEVYPFMNF